MMRAMVRGYRASDRIDVERVVGGLGWAERYVAGQLRAVDQLSEVPTAAVFVEDDKGSFRGFVCVEVHEWNNLAQLLGLAVESAHRRRGAATALVAAAEMFARDAGARGLYVDTPVDNDGARAFYESRGYVADHVMSRYYADDLDGVTYVRFFAP
jgi:ribosomal protein S18 acetylase RimI-like enzyme